MFITLIASPRRDRGAPGDDAFIGVSGREEINARLGGESFVDFASSQRSAVLDAALAHIPDAPRGLDPWLRLPFGGCRLLAPQSFVCVGAVPAASCVPEFAGFFRKRDAAFYGTSPDRFVEGSSEIFDTSEYMLPTAQVALAGLDGPPDPAGSSVVWPCAGPGVSGAAPWFRETLGEEHDAELYETGDSPRVNARLLQHAELHRVRSWVLQDRILDAAGWPEGVSLARARVELAPPSPAWWGLDPEAQKWGDVLSALRYVTHSTGPEPARQRRAIRMLLAMSGYDSFSRAVAAVAMNDTQWRIDALMDQATSEALRTSTGLASAREHFAAFQQTRHPESRIATCDDVVAFLEENA